MTDTNLNDDMVKLVEYSIVTVEREKEGLLEGPKELIVTDDLTGNAFSNARIAKWIERTGGTRTSGKEAGGIVDPDSLRVYYHVRDRWPKEDLKFDEKSLSHERQTIEVLKEISSALQRSGRDRRPTAKVTAEARRIPISAGEDPFAGVRRQIEGNAPLLREWRSLLRAGAGRLAETIAKTFNRQLEIGEYRTYRIRAKDVKKALGSSQKFTPHDFDQFAGTWATELHLHDPVSGRRLRKSSGFTLRDHSLHSHDAVLQRVVASESPSVSLEDPQPAKNAIALGYQSADLGLASWFEAAGGSQREAMIGYQLSPTSYLWFGQTWSPDLVPLEGNDVYFVALFWRGLRSRQEAFFHTPLTFRINFSTGQIDSVSQQISKSVGVRQVPDRQDPFALAQRNIESNRPFLLGCRTKLKAQAARIAKGFAKSFNRDAEVGEIKTPRLRVKKLKKALTSQGDFSPKDFDQFAGRWKTEIRFYDRASGRETQAITSATLREKSSYQERSALQRVVATDAGPPAFETADLEKDTLALGYYSPDVGLAAWYRAAAGAQAQPMIGYRLSPSTYLWFGQTWDTNFQPVEGSKVYFATLVWRGTHRDHEAFFHVPLSLRVDFARGRVSLAGDQITKTVSIRDDLDRVDPFDSARRAIETHGDLLSGWRSKLGDRAAALARAFAEGFRRSSDVGGFRSPPVTAGQLEEGLVSQTTLTTGDLDQFAGEWRTDLRLFDRATGRQVTATRGFATLEKARRSGSVFWQRTVVSSERPVSPETPDLADAVVLGYHSSAVGLVSWLVAADRAEALVGFRVNPTSYLWIGQELTADLEPIHGPEVFNVALVWRGAHEGREAFFHAPLRFHIDFETGDAEVTGDEISRLLHLGPAAAAEDPFAVARRHLESHRPRLLTWRKGLAAHSETMAEPLSDPFNRFMEIGDFPAFSLDPKAVASALASPAAFSKKDFDQFAGTWKVERYLHDLATGRDSLEFSGTTVREKTSGTDRVALQRVVVSAVDSVTLDGADPAAAVAIGFHESELGLASWLEAGRAAGGAAGAEALIGYRLTATRYLWFGQELTRDLEPAAEQDTYNVALVWRARHQGKPAFFHFPLTFQLDFETGAVKWIAQHRIRKTLHIKA